VLAFDEFLPEFLRSYRLYMALFDEENMCRTFFFFWHCPVPLC
jgi:hypothetical protein